MKTMKPIVKKERGFFFVIFRFIASYSETATLYKKPETHRIIQKISQATTP